VAVNGRVVERELAEMLMAMRKHRKDLAAYSDHGDAFGVARCERLLKCNYSRIRNHCAMHGLDIPHDVPPEGAE
jgi:hypothetical protein